MISTPRIGHRAPVHTATAPRLSRGVAFAAMSAALVAFFAAAGAPSPLLPLYEARWGFAPSLLTLAFGVYAIAMIAALLTVGSLSDFVGRRPVLIGALGLELVSMVVFLAAQSIGWIIAARILQGLATGVASSTFGAAIVELAPEHRKRLGAVMSSLAATGGLGIGALFSGVVALLIPSAAEPIVWIVLVAVMAIGTVLAVLTPETTSGRPGALASLRPRLTVPRQVRRLFAVTAPSVVAAFLETALFLGLIAVVLANVFGVRAPIVGGLVDFVMFTTATVVAAVSSRVGPHALKAVGNAGLVLGSLLLIGGIAVGALPLVWAAAVVAGAGMGAAFSGSIRGMVPEVAPHERAQLLSVTFTIAYLTFGGSAILAGFVAAVVGTATMTVGFTVILVVVALVGLVLSAVVVRRARTA